MRLPPKWLRRILIDPAITLGVVLAAVSLPLWAIATAFVSRYVPGKWRILRLAWFLFLYLGVEAAALILMFGLWIGSGFGWKIGSGAFQTAHYWLLGWMLRLIIGSAKRTFKLTVDIESPPPVTADDPDRRPILVLSRHAGPGDSMLLVDALANGYLRRPRIVLKDFLQWDPAVDVILNRLPTSFVATGKNTGESVVEAIAELARTMSADDAFVIFPEGANYTERRRERAIGKLVEIGRPDLAERARNLKMTLPPKPKGVMTALATAPTNSDVFFVGHAGLESFVTARDIWRGMPMDTSVAVRIWHFPAETIPPAEAQETWLYDLWEEIDTWIEEKMEGTG
ncbi:MAG TPA: 1-acyl-sn-glycerol-3-phosphate acyltransferase [Acidimicrobiia bacterium]|nr:1-acyl-sn-glycerol-3-phosphate acyltransferase [Acidimicrobiia bacterium]